jgi:hypothetical protein
VAHDKALPAASSIGMAFLLAASVAGTPQVPLSRVTMTSHVDASKNGSATITNLAPVPLDAYLLEVILEPCNPTQPRSMLRAADALLAPSAQPLRQNESRTETLGNSPCNKVGPPTPNHAELRAAIFRDGSSTGDAASTGILLDNRRAALAQLEAVLARLKAPDAALAPANSLAADLGARAAAVDPRPPFPRLMDVAALATSEIDKAPGARADQIAHAVTTLESWRQKLLDSKPALR